MDAGWSSKTVVLMILLFAAPVASSYAPPDIPSCGELIEGLLKADVGASAPLDIGDSRVSCLHAEEAWGGEYELVFDAAWLQGVVSDSCVSRDALLDVHADAPDSGMPPELNGSFCTDISGDCAFDSATSCFALGNPRNMVHMDVYAPWPKCRSTTVQTFCRHHGQDCYVYIPPNICIARTSAVSADSLQA